MKQKINWKTIIIAVVLSALTAYLIVPNASTSSATDKKESVYDRVMRTKTLKCGYALWSPALMKDPQTGEMSGVFYEVMEKLSQSTGIKIKWEAEIEWGQVVEALKTRKIDAICASMWPSPEKGLHILFSKPAYYSIAEAYIRKGDKRFDNNRNLSFLNNPDVNIAVIDNDVSYEIAKASFPKANTFSVPSMLSADTQLLLNVATKKADVTFTSEAVAIDFRKHNPGKIERFNPNSPVRVYENTIGLDIHEHELLSLLNTSLTILINSGEIDQILDKYEKDYPNSFRSNAKPFSDK